LGKQEKQLINLSDTLGKSANAQKKLADLQIRHKRQELGPLFELIGVEKFKVGDSRHRFSLINTGLGIERVSMTSPNAYEIIFYDKGKNWPSGKINEINIIARHEDITFPLHLIISYYLAGFDAITICTFFNSKSFTQSVLNKTN
jgi:hypothetical protein